MVSISTTAHSSRAGEVQHCFPTELPLSDPHLVCRHGLPNYPKCCTVPMMLTHDGKSRLMHHGEASNIYTCYRALFNVLANHRAGNQWPGTMYILIHILCYCCCHMYANEMLCDTIIVIVVVIYMQMYANEMLCDWLRP